LHATSATSATSAMATSGTKSAARRTTVVTPAS
jgi:hypothetical protein